MTSLPIVFPQVKLCGNAISFHIISVQNESGRFTIAMKYLWVSHSHSFPMQCDSQISFPYRGKVN